MSKKEASESESPSPSEKPDASTEAPASESKVSLAVVPDTGEKPAESDLTKIVEESKAKLADAALEPPKRGRPAGAKDSKPRAGSKKQAAPQAEITPESAPLAGPGPMVPFIKKRVMAIGLTLSERRQAPGWKRTPAEAEEIAASIDAVLTHYMPQMTETHAMWIGLGLTLGGWVMDGFDSEAVEQAKRLPRPTAGDAPTEQATEKKEEPKSNGLATARGRLAEGEAFGAFISTQ